MESMVVILLRLRLLGASDGMLGASRSEAERDR